MQNTKSLPEEIVEMYKKLDPAPALGEKAPAEDDSSSDEEPTKMSSPKKKKASKKSK